jgi:hypothetical protein
MNRYPSVVIIPFLLLACPSIAHADDKAEAAEMYRIGHERFVRGEFDAARSAFTRAYALDPVPRYLWDLAVSEHNLHHPVEALRHFRKYLSLPGVDEDHRRKARRPMSEDEAKTLHVVIDVPEGTAVTVDGLDATLYADHTIDLVPGRHAIDARSGGSTASVAVEGKAGETVHPPLRFEAPPAPPPAPAPVPQPTPIPSPPASPASSSHEEAAPPAVETAGSSSARWITSGIIAGAGVAGLITGGAFLANAASDDSRAQAASAQAGACPQPPTTSPCVALHDALYAKSNDTSLGQGFMIGGGVLVAGAVVTFLLWPKSRVASQTGMIAPLAVPNGGGALWTGTFE